MPFKQKILAHKKLLIVICLVLLVGGYYWYKKSNGVQAAVRYVTTTVQKGTLIQSVGGTGQVSALQQLDIKPLASGTVTSVKVKIGDLVKAGQVLLTLDQRNANVSLLQAKASLTTAEVNYQQVISPTQTDLNDLENAVQTAQLTLNKAKVDTANSLATAQAAVDTAYNNLQLAQGGDNSQIVIDAYQSSLAFLQSTLSKVDSLLTQADNILGIDNAMANDSFEQYLSILDSSKLNNAKTDYLVVKQGKVAMHNLIDSLSVNSSHADIENGLKLSEDVLFKMTKLFTDLSAVTDNTVPVGTLTQSSLDSMKSSVISSRSSSISQYSSVITQEGTLTNAKNSYTSYQKAYDKANRDLAATQVANENTLHSDEVALQQAQDNLNNKQNPLAQDVATVRAQLESAQAQYANALNNFNGTIIKAPFDGQVAAVAVGVGDQATVSSQVSASTAVLTLITPQKIAKITLNEVDVAKVKVGQKTNLTFDAVADLTITGTVVQVDTIGTVSQGVVSYGVNIVFDVQDDRIKPGMSVNANIILDSKTDVLMVPNSVVKNQNEQAYVQELVNGAPQNKNVEVGDSNDTMTEITSGLTEGETVISQTISTNNTGTQTTGSANAKGNGGGIRIPGL